jgi:hypothetical protein
MRDGAGTGEGQGAYRMAVTDAPAGLAAAARQEDLPEPSGSTVS